MKLTKKKEAALLQVYETWWHSYLNGDVDTYDFYLDDDYHFVGSTNGEEYLDRESTTAFFKATAHQLAGKAELRNRSKTIEELEGGLVLITDVADAYVISQPEWVFYSRFRFTSIMRKRKNGWRFFYQHFSAPDTKAQEGETLGTEQITKENQELRDAIKRRTVELEHKNRELAIEAALEKVRSRSLAMQKSDELQDVINTVFDQMNDLAIETSTAVIIIEKQASAEWECWLQNTERTYSSLLVAPFYKSKFGQAILETTRNGKDWLSMSYSRKEKNEWYSFMFEHSDFRHIPEERKKYILDAEAYDFSMVAIKNGGILLVRYYDKAFTQLENEILKKFARVFEQTYTRFLDLQKAEAQAREARIEAALERVRSRSLAMHHSDELREIIGMVYIMLSELKVKHDTIAIQVFDFDTKSSVFWPRNSLQKVAPKVMFPYDERIMKEDTCHRYLWEAMATGKSIINKVYTKQQKDRWFEYIFANNDYTVIEEHSRQFLLQLEILTVCFFPERYSGLYAESWDGTKYSEEDIDVLKRAARVFEQAYVRFLDLQKAEEQSREARIEAALERVRSKAMAMHKSEDLGLAVTTIFEEFEKLNVATLRCGIAITDRAKRSSTVWTTVREEEGMVAQVSGDESMDAHPLLQGAFEAWMRQADFSYVLEGDDLAKYYNTQNGENFKLPESQLVLSPAQIQRQYFHLATFHAGSLFAFSDSEFTDEVKQVMKRFANVFDLTYKRFLDLEKAERQAREIQIQLALERVRARTMAMQRSDELQDTSLILFQQLKELGEPAEQCTIGIIKESEGVVEISATLHGNKMQQTFRHTIDEPFVMNKMFKSWKDQQRTLVLEIKEEELQKYNQYRNELVGKETFPVKLLPGDRWIIHIAYFSEGMLALSTNEPRPAESLQLLERFAIVFEQTYTRFLDLQKAEAQAREAQIEAALERVRSKTMAMHKSEELPGAASLLFHQIQILGVPAFAAGYCIWDEDKQAITLWMSSEGVLQPPFKAPTTEDELFIQMRKGYENGRSLHIVEMGGEELVAHYKYMRTLPVVGDIFDALQEAGHPLPVFQVMHYAYFSKGFLLFITYEPVPNVHDIFKRFGKVFEQTYTRFNDLKQAEAQAREAQIEAALERIRASAMAMHTSDDIVSVTHVLREQMTRLGEADVESIVIHIYDEKADTFEAWYTYSQPFEGDKDIVHGRVIVDWSETERAQKDKACFNSGASDYTIVGEGKMLKEWYEYLIKIKSGTVQYDKSGEMIVPDKLYYNYSRFKGGAILLITSIEASDASKYILKRATEVFYMAYTRFLDLQKAEAQAREAQIEAALERVRSRTMAMHKTDELLEAAELVGRELSALGVTSMNVSYAFVDDDEKHAAYYSVNPVDGKIISFPFVFPHTETKVMRTILSSWKKQDPFKMIELDEQATLKHQTWVGEQIQNLIIKNNSGIPFSIEAFLAVSPKNAVIYTFNFKQGYLFKIGGERLTTAQEELVLRFTKVFEMTYRRFLDLKQAELQTRETQIELGLERVRARAMAMQNSDELKELIGTVFTELTKLDLVLTRCLIMIYDTQTNGSTWWMANSEAPTDPISLYVKNHQLPPYEAYIKAWKERKNKWQYILEGKDKNSWDDFLFAETELSQLPDFVIAGMKAPDRVCLSASFNNFGCLNLATLEPLSAEHFDILLRFAKVFDLTYTRFNDLQKAEAQAKEARIEISLERIRARALAMHKSDELLEVAIVMREQMAVLGQPDLEASVVHLYEEDPDHVLSWRAFRMEHEAHKEIARGHMPIPKNSCEFIRECLDKFYGDLQEYTIEVSGTKQDELYDVMARLAPDVVNSMRQMNSLHEKRYYRFSKFSGGALVMVSKQEPAAEAIYLQNRAAVVFDLAYRRFLDLQKAEAQAKEAKIEAALERVRSRSMGMQKSEELREVGNEIYKQLVQLNFDVEGDGFMLDYPGTDDWYAWGSDRWGAAPDQIHYPYINHPYWNRYKEAKEKGLEFFATNLTFEEKNTLFDHFFKYLPAYTPEVKKVIYASPGMATSHVFLKNVVLYVWNLSGIPYTDAENAIIMRFGKVFEQAYIRFND